MKRLFSTLCAAGALACVCSCGTARKAAATIDALDGEWRIVEVEGQALSPKAGEKEAFIGFNVKENRLYGNTGCNNLVGGLQADAKKGTISFGQAGSTRMMCADMETEQRVLGAMGKVGKYEISADGTMTLETADGKAVMTPGRFDYIIMCILHIV